MEELIENAISELIMYIEKEGFRGYDPFDALNSPALKAISCSSKWLRIAFTQLMRRTPFNLRPLFGMPRGFNPKGMGLFLGAYANLYKVYRKDCYLDRIDSFANWLIKNRCESYLGYCWGYNFDWQNRDVFRPIYTPTIVTTTFIANGFLDAYEVSDNDLYLEVARSSCDFITGDLNKTWENDTFCWSYSPLDRSCVYNATMLGARLLARVYSFTGERELIDEAEGTIRFAMNHQNQDGSWVYGLLACQQWIDSFHTGYNLECLYDFMKFSGIDEYQSGFDRGLQFYRRNFFLDDLTPKYYHNRVYPIDIHCPSQAIICSAKFGDIDFAEKVAAWTIRNMRSPDGYFYYRLGRYYDIKIPYMRWSQAWMFYALSTLLVALRGENYNGDVR